MKLRLLFVLLASLIAFNTLAQDRRVSLKKGKHPLKTVLEEIQKQSGYNIIYSDEVISDTMMVPVETSAQAVSEALNKWLPEHRLFYKMLSDKIIVIGSVALNRRTERSATLNTTISGRLVDDKNVPVQFASVGIMLDSAFVTGTTVTETGAFSLSYAFKNKTIYTLKISSVGYQTLKTDFQYPDTAFMKNLVMKLEHNTLNTVHVTAERPLVDRRADRYIVNVEGSVLANGNTGLEVLQKSPGIWVSNDGSIKIKGNQSVMVMINDVVQRMSSSDLAEYLRTIRSEDISKIEVISNPPSEFEAEGSGGIIHIILKKARKNGFQGLVSAQYRQQVERPYYGFGTSLDYKLKNFYAFGNINYGKDQSEYIASNQINYPDLSRYSSNTERYNNNMSTGFRFGAVYDIAQNQLLGFQTMRTSNKLDQYFDTRIRVLGENDPLTGLANSVWIRRPEFTSNTLNYSLKTDSLGSGLKVIADYVNSKKTETNDFVSTYSDPQQNSNYRNNTPNTTNLYSVQTDFTQVFKNLLQFKTGLKYAATKRDNEVLNENLIEGKWVKNDGLSNKFIYREELLMAYASLEKKMKQTSIKVGLRAEQTYMNGNSITSNTEFSRQYLNLFPSLFIMQQLNESKGTSLLFNYSRRLRRPSFADLNPYRLQFDDYLTQMGNPDLLPEYTHKVEIGFTFLKGFSVEIYYGTTNDKIAQLARSIGDRTIEYQSQNFNNSDEYGLSLYAPVKLFKWWTTSNNLALYNLDYNINDINLSQTTFYASSSHSLSFSKLFDADAWVYYRSPYVNANSSVAHQFITDLGVSKKVLKNKGRIRFYASDIFNTAREKNITEYAGTRIDFYQKRPTRAFNLSLNYNFSSGKKFNNKKIEQSNEEEKRRIGN